MLPKELKKGERPQKYSLMRQSVENEIGTGRTSNSSAVEMELQSELEMLI